MRFPPLSGPVPRRAARSGMALARDRHRTRSGVAIPIVLIFLSIVAMVALATSFQSSFVRRSTTVSHYGFEAVELCESAINEAAAEVTFRHVFPEDVFGDMKAFLLGVAQDDRTALESGFSGYEFQFRTVRDLSGAPQGDIFVSMTWPRDLRPTKENGYSGSMHQFPVPGTAANAASMYAFESLSPVKMSVLSWRRDFAGVIWQDWGVLHFEAACMFSDGKNRVVRRMAVDRMFTIYAHTIAVGQDDPPDPAEAGETDPTKVFIHFIKSRSNLKTVILRS